MNKVKCDHCGVEVNKEDAIPCVWKDHDLIWYYCKRCDEGVFNGKAKVENKDVVNILRKSSKLKNFSIK